VNTSGERVPVAVGCLGSRNPLALRNPERCILIGVNPSIFASIIRKAGIIVADKEQKKVQKAPPKSNKQKKEMQKEKKAAKKSTSL